MLNKAAEWRIFPVGQLVECIADYAGPVETEAGWLGPLKDFHPEWYAHVPVKGERFTVREVQEDPSLAHLPGIVLRFDEIQGAKSRRQGFEVGFWSIYFAPVHRVRKQ